jgi:hypothetical protein
MNPSDIFVVVALLVCIACMIGVMHSHRRIQKANRIIEDIEMRRRGVKP